MTACGWWSSAALGRPFVPVIDLTPTQGGDGGYEDRIADLTSDRRREMSNIERWYGIWDFPKPTIAQVHGYAVAGGCELALMCDITIAAEDAQIGFPIVRGTGTPPVQIYPWLVGMKRAKELLFTGDTTSGAEAAQIGLINRAVPGDQLEETVMTLARRIAQVPADLLWLTKAGINRAFEIMGFRNAILNGFDIHIIGHHSTSVMEFHRIRQERGLREALKWRDGEF